MLYLLEPMSPVLAIRVASMLAYGGFPPLINMSITNVVFLIHDGMLAGKSTTSGNEDPEMMGVFVSQAARDLKLGTFDCPVICVQNPDLSRLSSCLLLRSRFATMP